MFLFSAKIYRHTHNTKQEHFKIPKGINFLKLSNYCNNRNHHICDENSSFSLSTLFSALIEFTFNFSSSISLCNKHTVRVLSIPSSF